MGLAELRRPDRDAGLAADRRERRVGEIHPFGLRRHREQQHGHRGNHRKRGDYVFLWHL